MECEIDYSEMFYYDETSPTFLRHKKDKWVGSHSQIKKVSAGDVAGGVSNRGYVNIRVNGKLIRGHKVVLALHGVHVPKHHEVDHIDGQVKNNKFQNLRCVSKSVNTRNRKKSNVNTSGIVGVGIYLNNPSGDTYVVAHWADLDKKLRRKSFPVKKLGIMVAFRDAIIHRQKMIEELNSQGAGYTERHGT